MFPSFLDHLHFPAEGTIGIHYWNPYCLQGVRKNNYKSFLSLKYFWTGCSVSKILCRCLLSVMKVLTLSKLFYF